MRRSMFPALAALVLSGCATAPVVKTEVVHITCPDAAPPVPGWTFPAAPDDMRELLPLLLDVEGKVKADRIEWDAYREVWEDCRDEDE